MQLFYYFPHFPIFFKKVLLFSLIYDRIFVGEFGTILTAPTTAKKQNYGEQKNEKKRKGSSLPHKGCFNRGNVRCPNLFDEPCRT